MATADSSIPQNLDPHLTQRKLFAWGLMWGGVVVAVMATWIRAKFPESVPGFLPIAFWMYAVVLLGLGVWQLRRPFPETHTTEQKFAILENHKNLVGMIVLGGGAVLLLVGIWLGWAERAYGLGEAMGLIILGTIGIVSGRQLISAQTTSTFQDRFLSWVIQKRTGLGMALLLGGGVLAIFGLWLRFTRPTGPDAPAVLPVPLWLGPIMLGLVGIGIGTYLRMALQLNATQARMIVLLAGGLIGLVVTLMTFALAWSWRRVLFGGPPMWAGREAWQLWLCAYLAFGGLALMFVSLLLARADIRANPALRRTLYGYNAVLTGLLLLVFLVVLNIVIYNAYPMSFTWSDKGLYSLSESTVDVLKKLKKPVKMYVTVTNAGRLKEIRYLLGNFQAVAVADKLEVEYISPDRDFEKFKALAERYNVVLTGAGDLQARGGILVVYGDEPPPGKVEPKDLPQHQFRTDSQLAGGARGKFRGEEVLRLDLQFFEGGKPKVYVLQGDGELSLKGRGAQPLPRFRTSDKLSSLAMSRVFDLLQKENLEVKGLTFASGKADEHTVVAMESPEFHRKAVPADADVVIIPGPSLTMSPETITALEDYMKRDKGRLIVLMDVVTDIKFEKMIPTGLERFLKGFGVEVTDHYVHSFGRVGKDPKTGRMVPVYDRAPTEVYAWVPEDAKASLAKAFVRVPFFVVTTARVVKASGGGGRFQAETFLEVSPKFTAGGGRPQENIWGEEARGLADLDKHNASIWERRLVETKRSDEPLPIAVTVTEGETPRLVVFGDAEFISDAALGRSEQLPPEYYFRLVMSSIDWLVKRPGMGATAPEEPGIYKMKPEVMANAGRIVLLPGWLMTLGIFGLGIGVWVVRRR